MFSKGCAKIEAKYANKQCECYKYLEACYHRKSLYRLKQVDYRADILTCYCGQPEYLGTRVILFYLCLFV